MKLKGISAIIATLLILVITLGLAGLAYTYISRIFTSRTATLSLVDAYCYGDKATVIIRNEGTTPISKDSVRLIAVNENCNELNTTNPLTSSGQSATFNNDFPAGEDISIMFDSCETGRAHVYRLRGPSNAFEISFYCA